MRAQVNSPTYTGGLWRKDRAAIVDPARLVWGLKARGDVARACASTRTPRRRRIEKDGVGVLVTTPLGRVRAGKVALATNAFKPLLKRIGHYVAPVYDYCMVTEPLVQRAARRDRLDQSPGPQRHHQPVPLLPAHRGQPHPVGRLRRDLLLARQGQRRAREPARDVGQAQQALLRHVPAARGREVHPRVGRRDRHVQPVLRVLGPGHGRDGSPTRVGYTGLGVASTRFGAEVMLDLLDGKRSTATQTDFVKEQAAAVPARAVPVRRHPGHTVVAQPRGPDRQAQRWLKTLDRMGLGFDS